MPERIIEPSLYPFIIELFKDIAERYGVKITGVQTVGTGGIYPDIFLQLNGHKLLVQVKIDGVPKLIEDIVKTYPIARDNNAELVGILLPPPVRRIAPMELGKVMPKLHVSRALVLTEWFSSDFENVELLHVVERIIEEFVEFKRTFTPIVNYLTIAKVAREVVEDLSNALRRHIGVEKYFNMAQAIIGRFDFYKSLLEEFVEKEEMKTYIADIIAYLVVLQLIFTHLASVKTRGRSILPEIINPLSIPNDLIEKIEEEIQSSQIYKEYKSVIGSLPYLLEILKEVSAENRGLLIALGRYIYAIRVLRPEHVKEELMGRIYQEGLPQETRKNLGAFFTSPKAARLLAGLSVDKWDEWVLDPACGSGTLLVAAYHEKMRKAEEQGLKNRDDSHKEFVEKHIFGIDIMQFAKELSTINLAFQNLRVTATPKIYFGDGIIKMAHAITRENADPLIPVTLIEYFNELKKKYEELELPRENIDTVIMNPPFTRRERIPQSEREGLERLFGDIVRGKVGYWAYFFAAADNVIKLGGKLASVTPEEFFAGASAESVRRFLFLGEVYDNKVNDYIKKYERIYIPKVIIRSGVEIAFSERAHYRDYLAVFEKHLEDKKMPLTFVVLNKRLDSISDVELVMKQIREFMDSKKDTITTEIFIARKIHGIDTIISKHIGNIKPLVGLSTIETQKLVLELLESLSNDPTLRDYEDKGLIKIRDYNPGQYTTRGVEEYARRLFISRYGGRGKISFIYVGETADAIKIGVKGTQDKFEIKKRSCVFSLRTPANVRRMDVTGEEEYAIINPQIISDDLLKLAGLIDKSGLAAASNDIKQAYSDLAGNILLVRRARLTSPNIRWLTFFSDNKIIGPSAPMICVNTEKLGLDNSRLLAFYLNSSIVLLQLLAYAVETEGAWIALQGDQVWSHIHIPNILGIATDIKCSALNKFNEVSKLADVPALYDRIKQRHHVQRQIDEISLSMLGLGNWIDRLSEIYDAILKELDVMQRILEESQKERGDERSLIKKESKKKHSSKDVTTILDRWLEKT